MPEIGFFNAEMYGNRYFSLHEVFGLHRGDTIHYVDRSSVDLPFIDWLSREKHIAVYGCSKQGKTSLRRKHIDDKDQILVTCDPSWSIYDLHAAILKAAGCSLLTKEQTSHDVTGGAKIGISATIKLPLLARLSGRVEPNACFSEKKTEELEQLPLDLGDVGAIVHVLDRSFRGQFIVIEEFHYLPEDTQRLFAFKLKTFHEMSKYVFIIVGVWLDDNRLIMLNPDLTGRLATVNADQWSKEDLEKVVTSGASLLNIEFSQGFVEQLANMAAGSLYIVRQSCYRACELAGVSQTQPKCISIGRDISVPSLIREVVRQFGDYQSFVMGISDVQADDHDEEYLATKKFMIYLLLTAPFKNMLEGVDVRHLRASFRDKHPNRFHPTDRQATRVLKDLHSHQVTKKLPPILDYDEKERIVKYADKGFIIWRKGQNRHELENLCRESLGIEDRGVRPYNLRRPGRQ